MQMYFLLYIVKIYRFIGTREFMAKTVCHLERSRSTQLPITALRAFSSQLSFGNNMVGIKTKATLRNYPTGKRFSPLDYDCCRIGLFHPCRSAPADGLCGTRF